MRRVACLLLVILAACGGGDKSTAPKQITGTYQLSTVNGSNLPGVIVNDPANSYTASVTAGSLTVNDGSTFSNSLTIHEVDHGTTTDTQLVCTGTFSRNGNSISFSEATTSTCGGAYTGSWDGNNALTVAYDSQTQAVYRR